MNKEGIEIMADLNNHVMLLEQENKELKEINERVKFENAMHVKELLKLKRKIIGDGLEYLLESPDLVFSKEDDD